MLADALERLRHALTPQFGLPESMRYVNAGDLELMLRAYDSLWDNATHVQRIHAQSRGMEQQG